MVDKEVKGKLSFERYFTSPDKGVYNMFSYNKTDLDIVDDDGNILFKQKNVEFPSQWSNLSRKIIASRYFYGEKETSERENSVKNLVGRVSETFGDWGLKDGYFSKEEAESFRDEIAYLALDQRMAFNSPVWFNVGLHKIVESDKSRKENHIINNKGLVVKMPLGHEKEYPQTSACFIQSVDDNMESIMDLAKYEALLFKYGSGTGTNISTLRSKREKLSGGGNPSGPQAYWDFYDKVAGIVKSGGKTRRAAKMDILNVWHPDILEFIESKKNAEKVLHLLIDSGMDWKIAREIAPYQNTNISVRVSDEFMKAIENDGEIQTIPVHSKEIAHKMPKYKARTLLEKIAKSTHFCGDPGIQYDDNINKWHTCKKSGKINASNPCSEFFNIDNTACNLASHNLMRFMKEDGTFDVEAFGNAIRITAIAQDLEIDHSSYPRKEIAKNSHLFRPLGMGYANLGSLLMYLGLPYDSDEARATASAITAFLTGKAYETSTEMAEKIGTFKEFKKNKKSMLEVISMHREELKKIDRSKIPKNLETVLDEAEKVWDNVIERGKKYGFRNAQATLLAPTGTTGRMMDCDTLGIEPELGLIQTKLLSDGGNLKVVNKTVEKTLKRLGYDKEQIERIIKYVDENKTIEGSELKEEHLAIFDCANKPEKGKRTISYKGHLKMISAVQPFLSGGISKTINMPKEASVEEIKNAYIDSWKMGIKSVSIYRDESKRYQPMSFSEKGKFKPIRRKVPVTSDSIRHKFNIASHEGYLHVGLFEDGSPGETFITMSKEGSTVGGLIDTIAILTSMCLQYNVPLEKLVEIFRYQKFEPRGLVFEGHSEIKTADSIPDYIFHYLGVQFIPNYLEEEKKQKKKLLGKKGIIDEETTVIEQKNNNKENNLEEKILGELGGFCIICATQMYKKGSCIEECPKCDYQDLTGCAK